MKFTPKVVAITANVAESLRLKLAHMKNDGGIYQTLCLARFL
jgi:uncharacterized protein (DUF169 family)